MNPNPFMFLAIVLIVSLPVFSQETAQETTELKPYGKTATQKKNWQFSDSHSDEFKGDKVNLSKWNIDPKDFGPWSWEPDNVKQKDGSMHLQMVRKDHQRAKQKLYYTSGMARNDQTITYGYFEARIKGCARYPGACPSFWLYSIGPKNRYEASDGETVTYSEIDIVELQQNEFNQKTNQRYPATRIDCNLHTTLLQDGKRVWKRPGRFPELCASHVDSQWDPRQEYHVYAVENTKEWITWYIDGEEVAKKPNLYWHLPMHVTLSLGLRYPFVKYNQAGERFATADQTVDEGFPTTMSVDYVRVWQLPKDISKKSPTDWSKDEFLAKEKVKWDKNRWTWNQTKVESNFAEIDADKNGIATGKERKAWYAKKK